MAVFVSLESQRKIQDRFYNKERGRIIIGQYKELVQAYSVILFGWQDMSAALCPQEFEAGSKKFYKDAAKEKRTHRVKN